MLPCLRRTFPLTWIVAVSSIACAHVHERDSQRTEEVRISGVVVGLRYAPVDEPQAGQVLRALPVAVAIAERWGPLPPDLTITIHPTHESLEEASRQEDLWWLRAWSRRASVDLQSPRTWSRGAATDPELTQLLAHELTHCVTFAAIGGEPRALGIPTWFLEGMATANSGERFASPLLERSASFTSNASFQGDGAPFAYAAAHEAFVALERRYGRPRIRAILDRVRSGAQFPVAFEVALGIGLRAFEAEVGGAPRDQGVAAQVARTN